MANEGYEIRVATIYSVVQYLPRDRGDLFRNYEIFGTLLVSDKDGNRIREEKDIKHKSSYKLLTEFLMTVEPSDVFNILYDRDNADTYRVFYRAKKENHDNR